MIHIPFSWEKIPGVPKYMPVSSPIRASNINHQMGLPLPPGSLKQPVRSVSKRMLLKEADHDPFVAAMIICTKEYCDNDNNSEIKKKSFVRKRKSFLFTCKHSFDVQEVSLLVKNEFRV